MQQTPASFRIRVPIGKNILEEELSQILYDPYYLQINQCPSPASFVIIFI